MSQYPAPRLLLLGSTGQLGWEFQRTLAPLGEVIALDYPQVDFTDLAGLQALVREVRPQVLINAAAYTDVDGAESEPKRAELINGQAVGALAEAASLLGAGLLHISTDYVFDGEKETPYVESDLPNPLGAYARSKLLGEQLALAAGGAIWIIRTAWMYSLRRENFLRKVLQWARTQPVLRIATDQIGSPTSAALLAETLAQALAQGGDDLPGWMEAQAGIYHLAGEGAASRFEFARQILRCDPRPEEQVCREVLPARLADFPAPSPRPRQTALDCSRFHQTFGLRLPPWPEGVRRLLAGEAGGAQPQ